LNHQSNKDCSKGVEILSIGTELLLGNILNTNSKWISEQLSSIGLNHFKQTTIGDNLDRISETIKEISLRSNLLITTGGLGPTPDDLTTEAIVNAFNCKLFERTYLWEEIKEKLSYSDSALTNICLKKQCLFPKDAQIINNPSGTAPGMIWHPKNNFTVITFPGVPSELKAMWDESAFEYIKKNFSDGSIFLSKTLKLTGISESTVSEKIKSLLNSKNPTVAPYANLGEVKLRITAKAKSELEAKILIEPIKKGLKENFAEFIFGEDNENLPSVIVNELKSRGESIVFAESCTGGLLSASLTSISGSSKVFKGSIIAYSNAIKNSLLNVHNELIDTYGAVSEEVAEAMAIGAKVNLNSDWAISVSGIAGPDGGTKDKPVGLVYISIKGPHNQTINLKKQFSSIRNRKEIQRLSVNECLNRLRLILLSYKK
tara:strand:+ start:4598 stop:5887 length:1290 start_codon:yes stop_codon:yes gene_type:complete